jgi:7,8-didemethyl-8-hydroxy-5-deazariboflavin synthase CofH subunit
MVVPDGTSSEISGILDRALDEQLLSVEDAAALLTAKGRDFLATCLVADELRQRAAGDVVTYVVNRNINFTNVCIKRCGFCAFSRDHRQEAGYLLPDWEIVRRAKEAWDLGATEVCIQAGLPPKMDGWKYVNLCKALKKALPDMHIHGFSPEEVLYGATRARVGIREYLSALKEAGVGSLPGTSAEILVQDVRDRIARGRITVDQWLEVIRTAHELGIPTTATIMFGHVESALEDARHLAIIRDLQRETGGFTEFVPLGFVYWEAPMFHLGTIEGIRQGPSGREVVAMHAVSRIMLNPSIKNIQVSWVKEGPKLSQLCLGAGANDLGGTLINESISTAAGAAYGQLVRPSEFRKMIRDAGRVPAERHTTYQLRKVFEDGEDPIELLDEVTDVDERFGSYLKLTQSPEFRYAETVTAR